MFCMDIQCKNLSKGKQRKKIESEVGDTRERYIKKMVCRGQIWEWERERKKFNKKVRHEGIGGGDKKKKSKIVKPAELV